MSRKAIKIAIGTAVATVFVVGVSTLASPTPTSIGSCLCPDIYAPVKCSNGKTYPNACVASCQKAKNCVPTGDI